MLEPKPKFDKPFFAIRNDQSFAELELFVSHIPFDYFEWTKDKNGKPVFRIISRRDRVATGVCLAEALRLKVDALLAKHEVRTARAP